MRRRDVLLGLAAAPVLGTVTAASTAYALRGGSRAPELGANDRSGRRVTIRSLRGSVVVVDFWASWCGPCARSFSTLESLYGRYRASGLAVIGVSQDDNDAAIVRFLTRHPVTFPILSDGDHRIAGRYDPPSMPSSFVVDRSGIVRSIHRGFDDSTAAALEAAITARL